MIKDKINILILLLAVFLFHLSCKTNKALEKDLLPVLYPLSINGIWTLTDSTGSVQNRQDFEELHLFKFNLSLAKINGKYGYLNKMGNWAIKPKFETAEDFYYDCAKVKIDGQVLYIDKNGNRIKFEDCKESKSNLSCFTGFEAENINHSIIEENGKIAIKYGQIEDNTKFIYTSVKPFDGDFFIVEKNEKFGFFFRAIPRVYNENSYIKDTIERYLYDEIIRTPPLLNTHLVQSLSKYHKYRIGEMWGILNWQQTRVTGPKYLTIEIKEEQEYFLVEFDKGKFGYIDNKGNEMFKRN